MASPSIIITAFSIIKGVFEVVTSWKQTNSTTTNSIIKRTEIIENDASITPKFFLGYISENYESGKAKTKAINLVRDKITRKIVCNPMDPGGCSYGRWQISTRRKTMLKFLKYLEKHNIRFFDKLNKAGGETGATNGCNKFISAWRSIATDLEFQKLEYFFIKTSHYDVLLSPISKICPDYFERHYILKNVLWSCGIQHGKRGTTMIYNRAFKQLDDDPSDLEIIEAIYFERKKLGTYFSDCVDLHKSLKRRFNGEERKVIYFLNS
ncbi:MAG: hypothetical protein JJV93_00195 [Alphaproteobacteria bacterium]|nr:hypothetical protein [Alphaproteobacteria bacterium]MBL0717676.1 hypothetical protein [Alphaproteobacteria bacterium]